MKMSLLDIQREIRELESKVNDVSVSIVAIHDRIDEFRNNELELIDYEMIRLMSLHIKFRSHPLVKLDDSNVCQMYLETLLSLVQAERGSDHTINRLIFIQWVLTQSQLEMTLEDLFKDSLKFTTETFSELTEVIPLQYRNLLIVDAMIIANICGQASNEVLIYIVNICSIFGIDKEQLKILSIAAKCVLKQTLGKIKKSDLEQVLTISKSFKHYLNSDSLNAKLFSQRTLAVGAADKSYRNFKWIVKQKGHVKKGDLIASYRSSGRMNSSTLEITAPCAGTLFQFRNDNINYGVISHENDDKEYIKGWVLQKSVRV